MAVNGTRVFAVGDSHTFFNYSRITPVTHVYLGAITMHRIGRDGFESVLPPDLHFLPGDIVISSYGEVDCSEHIQPIAKLKDWTWEKVIDDLVTRYLHTLLRFKGSYGVTVGVNCISPPGRSIPGGGVRFWDEPLKEQITIRKMMNAKLASHCEQAQMEFIDFYAKYEAADGSLTPADNWAGNHIDPAHNDHVISALCAKYDVPFAYNPAAENAVFQEWGK